MGIPAGPAASCYRSGWAWLMEIKITAALSFELSGVVCRFIRSKEWRKRSPLLEFRNSFD